ncbi:MAG: hypothetical protein M0Z75_17335 [Nitrospiraceae bacterium]|nr:hypothetical protein [Nitrospiraceae bacterium]
MAMNVFVSFSPDVLSGCEAAACPDFHVRTAGSKIRSNAHGRSIAAKKDTEKASEGGF